jgi:hypothetical protein
MPNEKGTRTDNPHDYRRMRLIVIAVLLALVSIGIVANLYTGEERFGSVYLLALLTAICGLLGLNRIKLG